MIFSDNTRRRGRLTAPERNHFATEADQLGIDTSKEVLERDALALVLARMANDSPANAAIVRSLHLPQV